MRRTTKRELRAGVGGKQICKGNKLKVWEHRAIVEGKKRTRTSLGDPQKRNTVLYYGH